MTLKLRKVVTFLPGLTLLLIIALVSTFIAGYLPKYIGKVFVAIILGILVNNLIPYNKEVFNPGIKLGLKKILKLAIILLGAGVTFQEIAHLGGRAVLIISVLITICFIITILLGRLLKIPLRQRLLITIGISICGNTAIASAAPVLKAEDDEVAVAVGIVTLFGVLGVLVLPLVGYALNVSQEFFGYWSGTAINDTSQVVAAGFIFGEEAGKVATTVKLIRNIMMAPVILFTSFFYWKTQKENGERVSIKKMFPLFILGFLFFALLNSLGLFSFEINSGIFSGTFSKLLVQISKFLILLALSGIGLSVSLKKLKVIGPRPFVLGFSVEILLVVISFFVNRMWGIV